MFRHLILMVTALFFSFSPVWANEDTKLSDYVIAEFGAPPAIPKGQIDTALADAIEQIVEIAIHQSEWIPKDTSAIDLLAQAKDPRLVWILTDMQRFAWRPEFYAALVGATEQILDKKFNGANQRGDIINAMMAWDMPAYPGYLDHKRSVFTKYIPGWDDILVPGDIDWHLVDWGGVNIDARPYDTTDDICNCIPAADNPDVSTAQQATWLNDDDIIFGIVINGEARAYPRQIMEVREMVNDTLGGRDLGIPYCTLCGAAQAYFTDELPTGVKRPILRTSGLLIRSNKVMYDLVTHSVFDTFLGKAVTGPLADIGLKLKQTSVTTATWGEWRKAHPNTTVLIEALALGRDFNFRENRDAHGPIFPVGDVDPRQSVHEDIVGVIAPDGTPIAFPRAAVVTALTAGQTVTYQGVNLELYAGGVRATQNNGQELISHQAFWFAWAQFHPETKLWQG